MTKETIEINLDVFVWECICGRRFAILNMIGESWGHWGNPNVPPFCPNCGVKLEKDDNAQTGRNT